MCISTTGLRRGQVSIPVGLRAMSSLCPLPSVLRQCSQHPGHLVLSVGRLCCSSSSSRWSARFTAACNTPAGSGLLPALRCRRAGHRDSPRAVSGGCSQPPPSSRGPSSPCVWWVVGFSVASAPWPQTGLQRTGCPGQPPGQPGPRPADHDSCGWPGSCPGNPPAVESGPNTGPWSVTLATPGEVWYPKWGGKPRPHPPLSPRQQAAQEGRRTPVEGVH